MKKTINRQGYTRANKFQNILTNEQIQELKKALETTDDLQLVVREFGEEW